MYSYRTVTVWTSRFSAWGLTTNTGTPPPPPIQKGALAVMQRCLITASSSSRTVNAFETVTMCWFWMRLSHGLTKASHTDWQELCARVSYFSHSAQSKYSIIFPYLQCNLSESQTIIYYVTYIAMLEPRCCVCVWPQRTRSFVMCGRWEMKNGCVEH